MATAAKAPHFEKSLPIMKRFYRMTLKAQASVSHFQQNNVRETTAAPSAQRRLRSQRRYAETRSVSARSDETMRI
jgi:hypothetical protein